MAEQYKVILKGGQEKIIDATPEMSANVAEWGARAVTIFSGISCGAIDHIIMPDGSKHTDV